MTTDDPTHGANLFKKGREPGPRGRRGSHRIPKPVKCPPAIEAGGLKDVWERLVRRSLKGDRKAEVELLRLFRTVARASGEGVASEPPVVVADDLPVARPAAPGGLPPGSVALLGELDLEIAYVVRRYRMGMPCHDVEILLAETQLAADANDAHGRTRRGTIAQTLTDMLADARAQALRDQPAAPAPPADETPEARRLRLLDQECAAYRKRHESQTHRKDRQTSQGPPESAQATDGDDTASDGYWARRAREKEVDQETGGEEGSRE